MNMHTTTNAVRMIVESPSYLIGGIVKEQYNKPTSRLEQYQRAHDPGLIAKRERERVDTGPRFNVK